MKWDRSFTTKSGSRVREAYFQDEKDAFTLRDTGDLMTLEDHTEFVYSHAERCDGKWRVTIRDGSHAVRIFKYKDDAIDLMLGKEL